MNDWTLMVYISADQILVNFAIESLKQLKRAAGKGVTVVAQLDANLGGNVSRYVFGDSGQKDPSLDGNLIKPLIGPVDMTDPAILADFMNMVTDKYPAKHYGLVLWGHGPELLFDDNVPPSTLAKSRRYFSPGSLRQALEYSKLVGKEPTKTGLDIIALDACCMAGVEAAGELHRCANYFIASQDDVPDASFPYEQLIEGLKPLSSNVEAIAKMIPEAYEETFQDYISTPANGLFGITLSALNLQKIDTITAPLKQLASALTNAAKDPVVRKQILSARSTSHDFEFGLFVDVYDFCEQLERVLDDGSDLNSACKKVQNVIGGSNSACVIANQACGANNERCHGLSVYFPFQTDNVAQKAVLLRKNSITHPTKDRIQRIMELEQDYRAMQSSGQTNWMDFIEHGWSLILAKEIPDQLDLHYSAQQCAQNLLPDQDAPSSSTGKEPQSAGKGPVPLALNDPSKTTHLVAKSKKHDKAKYPTNGDATNMPLHQYGKHNRKQHHTV